MKKVLIAIPTLYGGGAERVATIWANQLTDKGIDVSFLVYCRGDKEYKLNEKVKVYSLNKTYLDYKKMSFCQKIRGFRKLVKNSEADLLISFLPRMQIWMMLSTFFIKIKRIETVRISPWAVRGYSKWIDFLWRKCFNRADKIIIQTKEQAEFFNKKNKQKCEVVFNPISDDCIKEEKQEYSQKNVNFIAVGRIEKQKNYSVMIDAFSEAKKECTDIKLSIYGEGNEKLKASLQEKINRLNLQDTIEFKGRNLDVIKKLKDADAFIMTSNFEGLPNALIEAMAVKLPCVSTNCKTGPKDLIDSGENGILVEVENLYSIEQGIIKIAKLSKEESQEMGLKAREKVLNLCNSQNSIEKLIDLIEN